MLRRRIIDRHEVPWPTVGDVWLTIECPRPVGTARDFAGLVLEPLARVLRTAPSDAQVHEIVDPHDGGLGAGRVWRVRLLSQTFPEGTTEIVLERAADGTPTVPWPS
ncbi:MAG: hypothetical protein AB1689_14255 [Thermodesulfobacteriota bacterium]